MTNFNTLNNMYIDYVNNYLTVEKMAENYGLPVEMMEGVLDAGRYIHEGNHPDK